MRAAAPIRLAAAWPPHPPPAAPGASMTTPAAKINIPELLGNSRVGPLQKRVFLLCALCLIIDGFDVQAMGYVAPALVPDWKIDRSALGPVFSAANFGVLIGSLVFS